MKLSAARTAILLSLLFLVVYGGTNWLASTRSDSDLGTWYFEWELNVIPFVPLMIFPYMSIDLLFFLAAFLCRDARELRVFAQRVTFSILVAGAFFLLMPLKLAWPDRPPATGWLSDFVEWSCSMPFLLEYPHNLFPTLHITLSVILASLYARHTSGLLRVLLLIWFALIGASTLLIWQHHLVDLAGGFVLAGFALHLFREGSARLEVVPNARVGSLYAMACATVLSMAVAAWPWGVFLLWPVAGLGMVAAAYFGAGPGIFRKADGRLPRSAWFVLGPVLLGHAWSLAHYRRQSRRWDRIASGVLVGRTLDAAEAELAIKEEGVTAVLDLCAELSEAEPFRRLRYLNVQVLDLTEPTEEQLQRAVAFIREEVAAGVVYIHCKIGYSRSAVVAGAYLLATRQVASVDEAISWLRRARPAIVIRPEAERALCAFAQSERSE